MNWNFEPTVILGIVLASLAYGLSAGPWRGRFPGAAPIPRTQGGCLALAMLYLFLQSVVPTVLGGIITLAPDVLYPTYLHAPRVWDISAAEDQQWGGLIMWIPGALIYLLALTTVFFIWFEGQEKAGEIR